jgi:polyisoprenoid-binding protein YceI
MMLRVLAAVTSITVIAGSLLGGSQTAGTIEQYKVDPVHSSVVFRVNHAGLASFYGRFNSIDGTFAYHESDASQIAFDIAIQAQSVDSNNANRDNHLRSADFFNAAEFPTITFKSTGVRKAGDAAFDVTGDLTMRGVTKSITARLDLVGRKEMRGQKKAGFDGEFTINRHDFNVSYGKGALGDDVKVMFGLEGDLKP